jgi:hypothetical protein
MPRGTGKAGAPSASARPTTDTAECAAAQYNRTAMAASLMHVRILRQNQTIFIITEHSDTFGRIRSKVRRGGGLGGNTLRSMCVFVEGRV